MQRIALVDMDGTIVDYSGQLLRDLRPLTSPSEDPLGDRIELTQMTPWLRARISLIKSQPGWWRSLPRLEQGFMVIDQLREFGYDMHVATKGPSERSLAWAEKVEWCRQQLPDATVHIVGEKSLLYGRILFDDWPEYVESWLRWRPRGLAIMPAYSYNEHLRGHPNIFHFDGPDDVGSLRDRLAKHG